MKKSISLSSENNPNKGARIAPIFEEYQRFETAEKRRLTPISWQFICVNLRSSAVKN